MTSLPHFSMCAEHRISAANKIQTYEYLISIIICTVRNRDKQTRSNRLRQAPTVALYFKHAILFS